jgi:hypothetical protein
MGEFPDGAVAVDHMVRYGDDVEAGLTEDIDYFSQLHRAVRIFSVDVQIA